MLCAMAPADHEINDLHWFVGEWHMIQGARVTTEQWTMPRGGMMLGVSQTVVGEKTVAFEYLRIERRPDGTIAYVAKPSGQPEATFPLLSLSPTKATFENLNHDFPQRIIYEKKTDGSLLAAIEGTRNGALKRIEFPYKRGRQD